MALKQNFVRHDSAERINNNTVPLIFLLVSEFRGLLLSVHLLTGVDSSFVPKYEAKQSVVLYFWQRTTNAHQTRDCYTPTMRAYLTGKLQATITWTSCGSHVRQPSLSENEIWPRLSDFWVLFDFVGGTVFNSAEPGLPCFSAGSNSKKGIQGGFNAVPQ